MSEIPPDLLTAMRASEEGDPTAFLVCADWLQERGDPLGEWILLDTRAHLRVERARYFETHVYELIGDAADHLEGLRLEWCFGFLKSIRIFGCDSMREDKAEVVLTRLLNTRACAVRPVEVAIGRMYWSVETTGTRQDFIDRIVEEGVADRLGSLLLFDFRRDTEEHACNVTALVKAASALETLSIHGDFVSLDPCKSGLRRLAIHGNTEALLSRLSEFELDQLEELELWFDGSWDRVWPPPPPSIHTLRVRNVPGADELVLTMMNSPWWPRLQSFELSMVHLEDSTISALRSSHLQQLDLTGVNRDTSYPYWGTSSFGENWERSYLAYRARQAGDGSEDATRQLSYSAGAGEACWRMGTVELTRYENPNLDRVIRLLTLAHQWGKGSHALHNLVVALTEKGDTDQVECVARLGRLAYPRSAVLTAPILQSCLRRGALDEALDAVHAARELWIITDSVSGMDVLVACMMTCLSVGEPKEAAALWEEFLQRNQPDRETAAYAALVYCHLDEVDYARELIDLASGCKEPIMFHVRACLNAWHGRPKRARQQLDKAQAATDYPYAWFLDQDPILAELDQ